MKNSDAFESLLGLLLRLDELDAHGLLDSPEAEKIREFCDPLWAKLSDEEQERLRDRR